MIKDPVLIDVMAYLIKCHPSEWGNGLTNTRMNSLIYLADCYHKEDYGCPITSISWDRSQRDEGPFVKKIQKTVTEHKDIFSVDRKDGKKRFLLKDNAFPKQLSAEAEKILNRVIKEVKGLYGKRLTEFVSAAYPLEKTKK